MHVVLVVSREHAPARFGLPSGSARSSSDNEGFGGEPDSAGVAWRETTGAGTFEFRVGELQAVIAIEKGRRTLLWGSRLKASWH